MINFPSLRLNNSIQFLDTYSIRIGLNCVLMGSQFWTSARICSFCLSRRILILSFSMSRPDFRFWDELDSFTGSPRTCTCEKGLSWQQNFLQESDELVSSLLVLLAPEWTAREDSAFPIISSASSASHEYEGWIFILEDHCRSLWAVEVVEELGLITCERVVYPPRCNTSSLCASAVVLFLGGFDHMEDDEQDREQVDSEREKVEAREGEEEDNTKTSNERSNMWWHVHKWFCQAHAVTPWATMSCVHKVKDVEKKISCEVYLSTHTVGYSGSLSAVNETNCNKKKSHQYIFKSFISNCIKTCPTKMCLKRNAIVCIDLDG